MPFRPKRVLFEQAALDYPLGQELIKHFRSQNTAVSIIASHNRVTGIPGKTPREAFDEAKATLVFGVRKTLDFETCKPSAHFQLPLTTGCSGKCEYCYLMTTLGKKPYLRAYVNIDEILARAGEYISQRLPETTLFEGSATSDPVPSEIYTHALAKTIAFFAGQTSGRFRFVTKFTEIDSLLNLNHQGHTTVRFSINTPYVIERWEHATPRLEHRIKASERVLNAGYPIGFIIAPVFLYDNWQQDYFRLLETVRRILKADPHSFEFITHRFTAKAKNRILEIFPETSLPMHEAERRYKYGQFGYGKYIYPAPQFQVSEQDLTLKAHELFPTSEIKYFV